MDPNPRNFPILSYVMSKLPQLGLKQSVAAGSPEYDVENPVPRSLSSVSSPSGHILDHMPRLTDPKVLAAMTRAVSDVAQTRSVLQMLGERPDHESVDKAKAKIVEIESNLSKQLEEIVLSPRPSDVDRLQWRSQLADKEKDSREAAEKEIQICKAVIQLDEMHEAYEKLLKEAETNLEEIYHSAMTAMTETTDDAPEGDLKPDDDRDIIEEDAPVNEEVVGILQEALGNGLERVDLSDRQLKHFPEAFGRIRGLVVLNLSTNLLEVIPDSIAGLTNLEELNLSANSLESLPDSIGMLLNLKIVNVSANKLSTLPDSICHCRSLVELDASFNKLTYLPTNIGYELVNLKRLSIQLNKIRSLPTSICEMTSLCHLDAHFNEIRGLPLGIGRLTCLEYLNLSSNFNDLTELPDTFGDLTNLKELDLSNNQISALPDTFGRLDNLIKLNLDQNPVVIPPLEIVKKGVEAVKEYMAKRWLDILVEEERKSTLEMQEHTQPAGWLTRSSSWLSNVVSGVSGNVAGYLSPGATTPRDPFLDRQL